jgi:hypothetical protein
LIRPDRQAHGLLRERYREGMEDQLGALGLVLNCVVLWNTIYMDKGPRATPSSRAADPGRDPRRPQPPDPRAPQLLRPLLIQRAVLDRPLRDPDAPEDDES